MAWLTGWTYRKAINIDASSDGTLTNYQKKITVNYGSGSDSGLNVYCGSNCETDFDDIRFTSSDGDTVLDHYLVQKTDSDKAVFFVELDTVNSSIGFDGYIYYGNVSATQTSSGSNTFNSFEDFENIGSQIFDDAGSTGITLGASTTEEKEGSQCAKNDTAGNAHKVQLQNDNNWDPDNYYIEGWLRLNSGAGGNDRLGPGLTICGTAGTNNGYQIILDGRSSVSPQIRENTDYSSRNDGNFQISQGTWYILSVYRIDSSGDLKAELWTESQFYGTSPQTTTTRSAEDSHSTGKHGVYTYGATYQRWDAIWVRKRADDEPAWNTWGSEETDSGETASLSPTNITFTVPTLTAEYLQVNTAPVSPVGVIFTINSTSATHESVYEANISPQEITFILPIPTATYNAILSASINPISVGFVSPAVSATHSVVVSAGVSPTSYTFSVLSVSASFLSVQTAILSPTGVVFTVSNTTATSTTGTYDWGIKVSESGYDVLTAADKNLSLKSGLTLLKVFDEGTVSLTSTWKEITHNLGYIPQYLVYVTDETSTPHRTYLATADLDAAVARADTSKLYIKQENANQTEAYYFIFYEPTETGTAPSYTETSDYGIKISKDGVDVSTADVLELTFNSELNSLKIYEDGTITSTGTGTRYGETSHSLDKVPGYFAFYEVDSSGEWFPVFTKEDQSGKNARVVAWTEAEKIRFEVYTDSSATVKIHYYLMVDPGRD